MTTTAYPSERVHRATAIARRRDRRAILALVGPAALYLLLFFLAPLGIVFVFSFLQRGVYGQVVWSFNLENYVRVADPLYLRILWRSFLFAIGNMLICLLVSYPFAYFLSRIERARTRNMLLLLVMVPFWTNFLVRTYAWRVILGVDGPINGALLRLGLIEEPLSLLFNDGAVLIGLVYGYLPFMVLPLYAAIERIDFSLMEAARDLYADSWQAFRRVLLPLTMPGVIAGSVLVFIPSLGAFITPDLLGGAKTVMVGNLIQSQFLTARDWPFGSALSMVLMAMVLIATLVYFRKGGKTL